jgi:glycosyltransferase involved in cell wall biosynthesis
MKITVAMPCIPPRVGGLLTKAIESVKSQTLRPSGGISAALDVLHEGAAVTRQRALDAVRTDWVAFLDDDDFWYDDHLLTLTKLAHEHSADYVYSWFDGNNPFPMHRGRQMDVNDPHHTTMTVMVKTELAKAAGFRNHPDENDVWPGEDWNFTLKCIELGAKFAGTGEVTWHYAVHGRNTSGLPHRWRG